MNHYSALEEIYLDAYKKANNVKKVPKDVKALFAGKYSKFLLAEKKKQAKRIGKILKDVIAEAKKRTIKDIYIPLELRSKIKLEQQPDKSWKLVQVKKKK